MKIAELMIGDLVYIHEPECKGHRIDAIDELDGQVGADGEVYDECDIRPIPLTQEILTENGLSGKNYSMGVVGIESKHVDEEGTEIEDWHVYVWSDLFVQAKNGFTIAKKHCKYVHELQQLLRFAGIEKEITL